MREASGWRSGGGLKSASGRAPFGREVRLGIEISVVGLMDASMIRRYASEEGADSFRAMPHGPKLHHHVPQFYLERFASAGVVRVRRRDGRDFTAGPRVVAAESGFYDLPDGIGGVSKEIEHGLANIEGMTASVFRRIDATGRLPGERDLDSATLALFLGLQIARTTQHRERVLFPQRVLAWANGRDVTSELVAEYLGTEYLGFVPEAGEIQAAFTVVRMAESEAPETLTQEFAVEMMLRSALDISKRLLGLHWSVEVDRQREFITSDTPVVLWRKPSPRDEYMGFGIETATEARFPLDPGKQLVMSRRPRQPSHEVAKHRVRRSNIDMAEACHRFIIGSPTNIREMSVHRLDRWRPVLRFNVKPALEQGQDGEVRPSGGDILHMWTPRSARVGRPRASKTG
jgi:hypothetical protein